MTRSLIFPVIFLAVIIFGALLTLTDTSGPSGANQPTPTATVLAPFVTEVTLPDLELTDQKGQKVKLADLAQPVLVTFWSSQCSECRKELPEITQFTVDHPEFKAAIVNVREETALVEQTLKDWNVTLPSYRDTSGQAFLTLYSSMPGSYFLQNGKITHYFPGRINSEHLGALLTSY